MQKVSVSMKQPNCKAKEFFVIKECCPVRNATKRINKFWMQKIRKLIENQSL